MDEKLFFKALGKACRFVALQRDELCRLDTGIGDGDHGVTAERGFTAMAALCDGFDGSVNQLFEAAADTMTEAMGGAIGPVYGAFWGGAALANFPKGGVSGEGIAEAFDMGCGSVMSLGRVSPGDKTVVDAMFACKETMLKEKHNSLAEVLKAGAIGARQGAEATVNMVAKRGRARFMGEKSIGYTDAGAVSFTLLVESLAEEVQKWS